MQSGRQKIIQTTSLEASERKKTITDEEALILDVIIPQRQRVEKLVSKGGTLTIGLCVGYRAPNSQVGSVRDHFQAVINYLQRLKQIAGDFESYSICLFPNPRNKEKVQQYFEEVEDLLHHAILEGKVYVMGEDVQLGDIALPNYAKKDEENWTHALNHFSMLLEDETTIIKDKKFTEGKEMTMKAVLKQLLQADMKEYLERNPDVDPQDALKKLKEEVTFYIATGLKSGQKYNGNVLLSMDKAPLLTMQFVLGNRDAAAKLERLSNCITHQEMSIVAKENELVENERIHVNNSNNSNDVVDNIVNQLVRAEGVSADIKGAILASFAFELEKKKACEQQARNSTSVIMGKFAGRSPKVSPGDSPRESKHQKTGITAPTFNDKEIQRTTSIPAAVVEPTYSNNTNTLYATRSGEHSPNIRSESKSERMGVVYG